MQNCQILSRESSELITLIDQQLHPLLNQLFWHRGIREPEELTLALKNLPSPEQLKGVKDAALLIYNVIKASETIVIVADFDCDGATSCAVLFKALGMMGAGHVEFLVPNRFEYGYGLTPEIVDQALLFQPDLIITVDNGISSIQGVQKARDAGVSVLVTDHHLPGDSLPNANVIVNPNQPNDEFPSKKMAGVGVIFYVMIALRSLLREQSWFQLMKIPEPNLAVLLDLVALGTVADVVPLDQVNRILVSQGLARMNHAQGNLGIKALAQVAGRRGALKASDLGFVIGPRLNAAGRMDDMSIGIRCLLTDDAQEATDLARELDQLNVQRRDVEEEMRTEAFAWLENWHPDEQNLPLGLCLYQEDWHQGVIGILASRIKELYHRPVIVFAQGASGEIKGSARSVAGVHIRDVLDLVATKNPGLLTKFGGHAMAAGMSLEASNFDAFKQAFEQALSTVTSVDQLYGRYLTDGNLKATDLTLEVAQILQQAGPWGQAFPEPTFDGYFEVINRRVLKDKHLKLTLRLQNDEFCCEAIAFFQADENNALEGQVIHIVYQLMINDFRDVLSLQLNIQYIDD